MLRVGSLFSGIGGFDLGLERAGMRVVWQCEQDEFCRRVLAKHWPGVPCYEDVRELSAENTAAVDVLCGGFPCQPFSMAGKRGRMSDERWMWPEFMRVIAETEPRWVIIENVPGLLHGGVIDEPDDRCLCGRPDRRGGLHLNRQEADGADRRGDVRGGPSRPQGDGAVVRGRDRLSPRGGGTLGGSVAMEGAGLGVRPVARALAAVPEAQARAGAVGAEPPSAPPRDADEQVQSSGLDSRAAGTRRVDADAPDGVEPEGPGRGPAVGGGRLCPACGRPMGDSSARPVFRSGLCAVLGDLALLGFHAEWTCLRASDFGAPHIRNRVWIVAHAGCERRERRGDLGVVAGATRAREEEAPERQRVRDAAFDCRPVLSYADHAGCREQRRPFTGGAKQPAAELGGRWSPEPQVDRVVDGFPGRVDQLRALGNSLVPQIAEWIGHRIIEAEEAMNATTENAA